jgi:hypothetical protein
MLWHELIEWLSVTDITNKKMNEAQQKCWNCTLCILLFKLFLCLWKLIRRPTSLVCLSFFLACQAGHWFIMLFDFPSSYTFVLLEDSHPEDDRNVIENTFICWFRVLYMWSDQGKGRVRLGLSLTHLVYGVTAVFPIQETVEDTMVLLRLSSLCPPTPGYSRRTGHNHCHSFTLSNKTIFSFSLLNWLHRRPHIMTRWILHI